MQVRAQVSSAIVLSHNGVDVLYSQPRRWSLRREPGTYLHLNVLRNRPEYHQMGQAAGTGGGYGFSQAMKSWMDEACEHNPYAHVKPSLNATDFTAKYDYNRPGFSSGTGHFTQVSVRRRAFLPFLICLLPFRLTVGCLPGRLEKHQASCLRHRQLQAWHDFWPSLQICRMQVRSARQL